MQDTLFPALYGTAAVILSVPLYLLGLNWMGAGGVALAASLSAIFQVIVLYMLWNRRNRNQGSPVYLFYIKMMVFSAPLGLVLAWLKSIALSGIDSSTLAGSMVVCLIVGAVFVLILLVTGYGLKIKEITELADRVRKKIRTS
jgi:putative peptidoglycan lipid II flippase